MYVYTCIDNYVTWIEYSICHISCILFEIIVTISQNNVNYLLYVELNLSICN